MSEFLERIDELFADDQPESGAASGLDELADLLAPLQPQLLAITTVTGSLVAASQRGAAKPVPWRDVRERVAAALERETDAPDAPTWRVTEDAIDAESEPLVLLAWLAKEPGTLPEPTLAAVTLSARLTLRGGALARRGNDATRRLLHLRNEHETLRTSHRESVAELLAAREKQAHLEREYVTELEREVEKRSAALREALNQAERANEMKTAILANVSHEIRTPMTAILGYVDLLREPDATREEVDEYTGIIEGNGQQLLRLIEDLLDVSRTDPSTVELERTDFDPCEVTESVVAAFRGQAEEQGLALSLEWPGESPKVRGDAARLQRVLGHLVGNALKFTEEGSIRVAGSYRLLGGSGYLVIDVVDSGIGVTPEQMERLFEPFTQADASSTRRYGGAGLGLPLARSLAQAMGGDVTVRSESGKGSTFRVTVQVVTAAVSSSADGRILSEHAGDPDLRDLVQDFLDSLVDRVDAIATRVDSGELPVAIEEGNRLVQEASAAGFPPLADEARALVAALRTADGDETSRRLVSLQILVPRLSVS